MKRRDKSMARGCVFLTGASHRRLPLFRDPKLCEIFVDNLRFYRRKYGYDVLAFALLPDHYHLLLAVPEQVDLTAFLRDFKSQVGRQIVDSLKNGRKRKLLERLAIGGVSRRKDARYRALQPDNYVERVFSERFLRQKIDYIHLNPVREGLVARASDYRYSSAWWYGGEQKERTQWQGPLG